MLQRSENDDAKARGRLPKWAATGCPRGEKTISPESCRCADPCWLAISNPLTPSGTKKYHRRGTVTVCMSKVSCRPRRSSQSPQSSTICSRLHSNQVRRYPRPSTRTA